MFAKTTWKVRLVSPFDVSTDQQITQGTNSPFRRNLLETTDRSSTGAVASDNVTASSSTAAVPSTVVALEAHLSTGNSSSSTMDSSTAISENSSSSTGSANSPVSPNSPFDPWLARNLTSLSKVTVGDTLNDVGPDVQKYQPLYYHLSGHAADAWREAITTPKSIASFSSDIPPALLRNHTHPRRWLDREDFSLNQTTVQLVEEFGDSSHLTLSLPFLRQDLTKTSAGACTSKFQGVYLPVEATCISFRQLTGLCVRVKEISRAEVLAGTRSASPFSPAESSSLLERYAVDLRHRRDRGMGGARR